MHLNFHGWSRAYTVWWSFDEGRIGCHKAKKDMLTAVAVLYFDFPRNQFFWQWLVMNVPHTQVAGLLSQSVMHLPENLKYFAAGCVVRRVLGK